MIHERSNFAIVLGPYVNDNPQLREVNIFLGGAWVTCDDDVAFVPQFATELESTLIWLLETDRIDPPHPDGSPGEIHRFVESDEALRRRYGFMNWGPTTDNVIAFIFRDAGRVLITCSFWRPEHHKPEELGRVFHAELGERELLLVLLRTLRDL